MSATGPATVGDDAVRLSRRHLLAGWWLFLGFLVLGTVLESLHGFKVRWYVDVDNATRRLMWTLAHAHGALLGLVNLAYGLIVRTCRLPAGSRGIASVCLLTGSVLLPAGFLLGGLVVYGGDPGLGIFLTPVGAVLLASGAALTLHGLSRETPQR